MRERERALVGCLLIFASFPAYAAVAQHLHGLSVVWAGLGAYVVLGAGVWLAGGWLGIVRGKKPQRQQAQGCLTLLVTLIALVMGIAITYYIVFYGAAARMGGRTW